MPRIESTAEMAASLYQNLQRNLEIVRRRLARPLTLTDKLLLGHLDNPEHQSLEPGASYLMLRPDRVILHEALGLTAMLQFMQTGCEQVVLPTTIHCDHLIEARAGAAADLKVALREHQEIYDFMQTAAARYGAGFWKPGAGIIHQVVLENYSFPGQLIVGTDSHTPNAAGLGACAVGVGGADAAEVMAGLPWELLYPRRIAVHLTGALNGWAAPKDIILHVAGVLTVSGGTNAIVEYIGPGTRTLSATGKATIANMGAELGATTSLFPADEHMATYLRATGRHALVPMIVSHQALLRPDLECEREPHRYYDQVLELDLSRLEPHVSGPNTPDRVRPISQLAQELSDPASGLHEPISAALIGSCTNSSYEDMTRAADVARQARARGVKARVPLLVTPGSETIRATIERDGQMQALRDIGAVILANACGPCIGRWQRTDIAPGTNNTIVTSYNRNFPARNDGQASTLNLIASPEIVTAYALVGSASFNPLVDTLTDAEGRPFKLEPPQRAPEVPPQQFRRNDDLYVAPPVDGRAVEIRVDPRSKRLQLMQPWPAWPGEDLLGMPVLVKAQGKTTTDQISPSGPWMRYRGHIGRTSANMLMGAVNAYNGEIGKTKNVLTGAGSQPIAEVARDYQSRGVPWIVVGDHNYGEGSSREHAALLLRYLGGAAVIARSFARIHETNLKKQGLLALTFEDSADYSRIREDDRVDLVALGELAPGRPVECRLHHADGTQEALRLRHTYAASQLEWFRAGGALNLMQR